MPKLTTQGNKTMPSISLTDKFLRNFNLAKLMTN